LPRLVGLTLDVLSVRLYRLEQCLPTRGIRLALGDPDLAIDPGRRRLTDGGDRRVAGRQALVEGLGRRKPDSGAAGQGQSGRESYGERQDQREHPGPDKSTLT